jgi:hypothetical protein
MKYTVLLMILWVLDLCGCIKDYQNGKLISEQRHFPMEPRFTIRPNSIGEYSNSALDFEAIYFQIREGIGYNYYRFWPNGRVLVRAEANLPSREQAESFMDATIGYYHISGNNLVIELYVMNPGINEWDYLIAYAIVEDSDLRETKSVLGGRWWYYTEEPAKTYQSYYVYRKYKIEGLKRQPDW